MSFLKKKSNPNSPKDAHGGSFLKKSSSGQGQEIPYPPPEPKWTGVFRRPLENLLEFQKQEIPLIVQECVAWIDKHALKEVGLFRIPGDTFEVNKLKAMYDAAERGSIDLEVAGLDSPHTIAGLLKLYIRELPQPLLLYRFYTTFIKVQKNHDKEKRTANLRILIKGLPKHNKDLLLFVMKFLSNVAQNSDINMMNIDNLALVWGPNLLRPDKDDHNTVFESSYVNQIITTLITEVDQYLNLGEKPGEKPGEKRGSFFIPETASSAKYGIEQDVLKVETIEESDDKDDNAKGMKESGVSSSDEIEERIITAMENRLRAKEALIKKEEELMHEEEKSIQWS